MKLIQDLGMLPIGTQGQNSRYGMYECPKCESISKIRSWDAENSHTGVCSKCAWAAKSTHGMAKSHMYRTWQSMKTRTTNPSYNQTDDYIGRGITLCEEWENSFESFRDWSNANGYSENLTIDRKNNDKGYNPNNCRWTTSTQQMCNTRILKSTNTSGYRGVNFHKASNKWVARIQRNGERVSLGCFNTALEAAIAFNKYIDDNNLDHCKNILQEV